jgi:hypothetical protein
MTLGAYNEPGVVTCRVERGDHVLIALNIDVPGSVLQKDAQRLSFKLSYLRRKNQRAPLMCKTADEACDTTEGIGTVPGSSE